ncbi:MAG: 16S rRNA (cytidine(1402)-2'-O)-methyltransferase [Candidatus Kapabacteria bacterium]|nr:16S rRNA (cytidine(1402)-2'-O)-methyltransferase [Ignavibacteriota bacterium]MCW5884158.1 16S rRNA (cytidine(1402)-2'-O)-methyltransferase [Candidatus Kapabacteria bacterium]
MSTTENSAPTGKLYIVSTPIGNKDDITLRAINTIKRCDIIVCEEMKMGALTLKNLNLAKELIALNENNESDMTMEVLNMLKSGKKIALISDAGTPVFADPGLYLVRSAISNEIETEVVPGASCIMTAIVRSGFDLYEFLYAGFLPRKNEDRDRKIQKLARERRTVVILDTPYRMHTLLAACAEIMPDRRIYLGMNLTMPFETHHYGTFSELVKKFENVKIKAEFVLVMEGNKEWIGKRNEIIEDAYDDDEDDDSPIEYEYPVKAHAPQLRGKENSRDFKSRRGSESSFPKKNFSGSRGGSSRGFGEKRSYDKKDSSGFGPRREKSYSDDGGAPKRDFSSPRNSSSRGFGEKRSYDKKESSGFGPRREKSYSDDGGASKRDFSSPRGEKSFSDKGKFKNPDKTFARNKSSRDGGYSSVKKSGKGRNPKFGGRK